MAPRFDAITREISQVGGRGLTTTEDAAAYLVRRGDDAVLIDAGCGEATDRLLWNIEATGTALEQVRALLLTHCHFDHTGGAQAVRSRLGCTVVAHELDANYIEAGDDQVTAASWYRRHMTPCVVNRRLGGAREVLEFGRGLVVEAIHIPGHSPGSVAYLFHSEGETVLFGQDIHGPLDPSLLSNRRDYMNSLQRLLELEADILCEGHYGIFRGRREVARFIGSYLV